MAPMPRLLIIAFTTLSLMAGAGQAQAGTLPANPASLERERDVRERISALQVPFIENQGQVDRRVSFYAKTLAGTVFITHQGEIVYSLPARDGGAFVLTETLVNAQGGGVTGKDRSPTNVSYFIGNDPTKWKSRVPVYNTVSLGEVYEGIEAALTARGRTVEKLFTVRPGADPRKIRLALEGPRSIRVSEQGELEAETDSGPVTFTRPVAYQEIAGQRVEVAVSYEIDLRTPRLLYTFRLGPYDPTRALIIDPSLQSTYLGGSGTYHELTSSSLALGPDGTVYVAGQTSSTNFPGTTGGYQPNNAGGSWNFDAFIARLSADLTSLLQSTYLGGNYDDGANAIVLASDGTVYVAGYTAYGASSYFPGTAGGAQPDSRGGSQDGFIARLSADLTSLLQSTYLGNCMGDSVNALALGPDGTVYAAGRTESCYTNQDSWRFPGTIGGAQASFAGGGGCNCDAFVSRLSTDLTSLLRSTYLGGSNNDFLTAIAVTSGGSVYVTGSTKSTNFPGTAGGAQESFGGGSYDAFVSRLNADLTSLLRSTYLGGSGSESGGFSNNPGPALAIASDDTVYVTGTTDSTNFPGTTGGAQAAYAKTGSYSSDAFIARLSADLTSLLRSTYLGGSGGSYVNDMGSAIAIGLNGTVYVAGQAGSTSFPGTAGGAQATNAGGADAFVSRLSADLTSLLQSTYLGGSDYDWGISLAIGSGGTVYVAGKTRSTNFPWVSGGAQTTKMGTNYNAFVSKLPATLREGSPPTVTATTPAQGDTGVALDATISATFSEAMDPATLTTTTFTLEGPGGPVSGTVSYDPATITATFTPSGGLLSYNTIYVATITTGAQSLAGIALESNYPWVFTTLADTTTPGRPTGVTATGGNQQATITWVAPASDGGNPITSYTVTVSPGGQTVTVAGGTTTVIFTGLTNGTMYTFTVFAVNAKGPGPPSAPSNPVLVGLGPGAPFVVRVTISSGQATVTWDPYPAGMSRVISYTVTASPGGQTVTVGGRITTAVVTGLTNGVAYTFTVQALTDLGLAPASAPSDPVIPQ